MVSQERACVFGEIIDGVMHLNDMGRIVQNEWLHTSKVRPNIELDEFVVMPNHIHGIIVIHACEHTDEQKGSHNKPVEKFGKPTTNSIPTVMRLFKATTTKQINDAMNNRGAKIWQRNYYEHIIRNQQSFETISNYILNNPAKWDNDKLNRE